jgi:hypothetical protein
VNHWHLTQMRTVEIAMVADLIMWKSFDPTHRLPGSPWRSVLKCYASRSLYKDGPRPWSEPEPPPPKPGPKELWKKWPYYDTAEVYAKLLGGGFTEQASRSPPDQGSMPLVVNDLKPTAAPVAPPGSSNNQSLLSGQPRVRSTIADRIAQKHATQLAITQAVTPKGDTHDD